MKIILSLLLAMPVLADLTIRLDTEDGYFIEAMFKQDGTVLARTRHNPECLGSFVKDMVNGQIRAEFTDADDGAHEIGCSQENLTVFFNEEQYKSLYSGKRVELSFESKLFGGQRKTAMAQITSR